MEPVRYGIVGTGMMGVEHIMNLLAIEGTEVTAIADTEGSSLDRAASLFPGTTVPERFSDHRSMVDSGLVDAVVVVTPNMTHHQILLELADRPVHVLVEKPMCITVDQCRDIVDAYADRSHLLWVGLEYRFMPPIAGLIRRVRGGAAGDIKMIAVREHRFPFLPKVGNWNRFNRNTGGTLVEKCCHFFDLMTHIADARPVRVYASGAQDVNHLDERYDDEVPDIIDNAFVIVDYDNGVRAMLDLCMFAEASAFQEEVVVVGDTGKVEAFVPGVIPADPPEGFIRVGSRSQATVVTEAPEGEPAPYQGHHHGSSYFEHVAFRDAIRDGRGVDVSAADGLMSVAIGVAAHRSIELGEAVAMEEFLDF